MENIERPRNQRRSHGAGEARRLNRWECLKNLAVVVRLCVEPILSMLASFGDLLRHRFDSFMDWIREQAGGRVAVRKRRVMSRDLKSVQFLKQGLSGFVYETTWSTWYGMERSGRYARKDFPGVDSKLFEDEAARLVDLDHPNLVKTYCWTVDKLGCSLVMEFVNDDLESVVRERKAAMKRRSLQPLDPEIDVVAPDSPFKLVEAMYIMWHIAAAIEYLHLRKVAHGDLRPNNVMVDLDPGRMIVKVVDFGLIESKKRTTLVSKRAKFLQTLEWKAPELCEELVTYLHVTSDEYPWACTSDQSDDFQKLQIADMYSFAILCTYIMGGKVSYPRSNLTELEQKLLSGTLKPEMPSTCPLRLKKLIELCWSRTAPENSIDFPKFKKHFEDIIRQETTGGHSLNDLEVGGKLEGWVQDIHQMSSSNTKSTSTTTLSGQDSRISSRRGSSRRCSSRRWSLCRSSGTTSIPHGKLRGKKSDSVRSSSSELTQSESLEHATPSRRWTSQLTGIGRSQNHWIRSLDSEPIQSESLDDEKPLRCWTSEPAEIEHWKTHWSELNFVHLETTRRANEAYFISLKKRYGEILWDSTDDIGLSIGKKIAEGGTAELYEASLPCQEGDVLLKVFKVGVPLQNLLSRLPMDVFVKEARARKEGRSANLRLSNILGGLLLNDGRFAYAMQRYWGDLRQLFDRRMLQTGKEAPPFPMVVATRIITDIAEGMQELHNMGIIHRDLKAANILIKFQNQPGHDDAFSCVVADFESSIGVVGTAFWRAPEILQACKTENVANRVDLFTKKSDVYSFGIVCYEVLTGHVPFEDHHKNDYDLVLSGARPPMPSYIPSRLKSLVRWCWHHDPSERPTFEDILEELNNMK